MNARPAAPSRWWVAARVLLAASIPALAVTVWLLFRSVDAPDGATCGTVAEFVRSGARVDQPTCRAALEVAGRQVLLAFGAMVVLAASGTVLGLVDDRLALRRAPRFETLVRERPG